MALLGPQLPHLCEGYICEWTLIPVASGKGLPPRVTHSSPFAEDLPGLSTASAVSLEPPQPRANKDGWSPCLQGHFSFHHILSIATLVSTPAVSTGTWNFPLLFLPVHIPRGPLCLTVPPSDCRVSSSLFLSSLSVGVSSSPVCLWGPSFSSPVPSIVTLLVSGVSLFSALFCFPPLHLWYLTRSVSLVLSPGLWLATFPGWSRPPSLLSPSSHPQCWLGWEPGLGAVTRPGRGTQADMVFMLGLQSGAEPEAGVVRAVRGGRGGKMAGRSQTEVSSGPSLVRVSLVTHTSPVGTLRPRVGTEWAILVQSSKKGTSCTPALSPPFFLSVTLQEQLCPLSISPAWEAGAPGAAGAEGCISAGKHPWHWDRSAFSALWQRSCLAGQ